MLHELSQHPSHHLSASILQRLGPAALCSTADVFPLSPCMPMGADMERAIPAVAFLVSLVQGGDIAVN